MSNFYAGGMIAIVIILSSGNIEPGEKRAAAIVGVVAWPIVAVVALVASERAKRLAP